LRTEGWGLRAEGWGLRAEGWGFAPQGVRKACKDPSSAFRYVAWGGDGQEGGEKDEVRAEGRSKRATKRKGREAGKRRGRDLKGGPQRAMKRKRGEGEKGGGDLKGGGNEALAHEGLQNLREDACIKKMCQSITCV